MGRKDFLRKIVKSLRGTTRETAKTKQEMNLDTVEALILNQIIDKKVEDVDQGGLVTIKKTSDEKYYLEA
ncbi:MAG: hypothetical protein ABSG57_13290 [Candidatus Bathyarchaeia archaeon]